MCPVCGSDGFNPDCEECRKWDAESRYVEGGIEPIEDPDDDDLDDGDLGGDPFLFDDPYCHDGPDYYDPGEPWDLHDRGDDPFTMEPEDG